MRHVSYCAAMIAGMALIGCSPETSRPEVSGKGTVRAINAIPGSPQILFRIEERQISGVDYKGVSATQQWDDLEYTFNFDVTLSQDSAPTRVASQPLDVVKDKDYTLLVSGSLTAPAITIWERNIRTFEEAASVFEASFAHAAASLGPLDVYFAAADIAPAPGAAVGTIAFGEIMPAVEYAQGDYVLTYTTAGDHTNVIFTSAEYAPVLASSTIISIFDGDENDLAPVAVRRFASAGGSARLADANLPPRLRFINASLALGPADVYSGEMLETLLVENLGYGQVSASVDALVGANTLTFTTPMNTNVILFEDEIALEAGSQADYFLLGEADNFVGRGIVPDRRSIVTLARISILHAAVNHPAVDIYVLEDGATLADSTPAFFTVPAGNPPLPLTLAAGSYDVYVTSDDDAQTIIAGPFDLDVSLGDVVDLIVLDNAADTAVADIVTIPQP